MKKIKLTRGKFAKVDDANFEWLNQWRWQYNKGYAVRNSSVRDGKRYTIFMHRLVICTPDGMETDHIDRDGLNNQRKNLRICVTMQNRRNSGLQINNASGYKGVSWDRGAKKWRAYIMINRRRMHLGLFKSAKIAAHAYDDAAIKYFNEFASPNFPKIGEMS